MGILDKHLKMVIIDLYLQPYHQSLKTSTIQYYHISYIYTAMKVEGKGGGPGLCLEKLLSL